MFFDNAGAPIRREYSLDEFSEDTLGSLGAAFRQSYTETVSGSTWRSEELIRANLGKGEVAVGNYSPSRGQEIRIVGVNEKISNEDAERQIKESGLPLKVPEEGFTQQGLDIVMERKRNELMRKKQMDDAKGFVAGAGQFTAGMVAQVLDPVNIAASFVPAVSAAKYSAWIAAQSSAWGRAGVRAGVGAVEGLAGAALIEPIIYQNLQREQADYTLADSLINVGLGTVLGGGLHMGVGAYSDAIKKGTKVITEPKGAMPEALERASPETRQALLESSVAMEAQGYRVDVEAVAKADPGFKSPSGKRTYYHGTDAAFADFDPAKSGKFGANYGDVIFLTSDPDIASGYSIRRETNPEFAEMLAEAERLRVEMADIVKRHGANFRESAEFKANREANELNESKRAKMSEDINQFRAPTEGANVRPVTVDANLMEFDAKGKLWMEVNADAIAKAKDGGFDGVEIKNVVDSANMSTIGRQSDVVAIFDPSKIKSAIGDSQAATTPEVETAVKNGFSPDNMRGVDKAASLEADKVLSTAERDIDQELEGVSDLLAEYEKMGAVPADLKVYDQAIAKAEEDAAALRAATLCGLTR